MSNTQRISAMYGDDADSTSVGVSGVPQLGAGEVDAVALMYPTAEPVKNPYSLDPESIEAQLYADTETLRLDRDTEVNINLLADTDTGRTEWRTSLEYLGGALGATQDDMSYLVDALLASRIGKPGISDTDSLKDLVDELGPAEATRKIGQAKELVDSFPDLRHLLNRTKVGNDPALIRRFIRLAESPRGSHRLRTLRKQRAQK